MQNKRKKQRKKGTNKRKKQRSKEYAKRKNNTKGKK